MFKTNNRKNRGSENLAKDNLQILKIKATFAPIYM